MVFAARQLQAKCQEQNVDLYSTYVDLTKAFDTASRFGVWWIMANYGCPNKFIAIVRKLHEGMRARVRVFPGGSIPGKLGIFSRFPGKSRDPGKYFYTDLSTTLSHLHFIKDVSNNDRHDERP